MSKTVNVNPWVVREKKEFTPLPIGFYQGGFLGIEEVTLPDGSHKWRFSWKALTGEFKDKIATALCNRDIAINTHAGRLISGLLGRQLVAGEDVLAAVKAYVGKVYLLSVGAGPKGGKRQAASTVLRLAPADVAKTEARRFR
jgi:hypothetical protein